MPPAVGMVVFSDFTGFAEAVMADGGESRLVWLDDPAATGVELVGAKAANLAVSANAGLPMPCQL